MPCRWYPNMPYSRSRGGVCAIPACLATGLQGGSAPWGGWSRGELVSHHALRQTPPPGETATAADGTHPTGKHPCSRFIFFSQTNFIDRFESVIFYN